MLKVLSPVPGLSMAVADVPDPVFARELVGPGVAIQPRGGRQVAVAPVAGQLVKLHPHAFVVLAGSGLGVLVHLGVDTVHMHGEGFHLIATEGDEVAPGDEIVEWDPDRVEAAGHSALCCVVVLDRDAEDVEERGVGVEVTTDDVLFEISD